MGICFNDSEYQFIEEIIQSVADSLHITTQLLKAYNRRRYIILSRQIAMYVLRMNTDCTLEVIGEHLGNRSPATIHWGIKRIDELMKNNTDLKSFVKDLIED